MYLTRSFSNQWTDIDKERYIYGPQRGPSLALKEDAQVGLYQDLFISQFVREKLNLI